MSERRQLGTILLESGRITPADVERVLEYQRSHGGFFGQGLIALGVVSREEIDWALANQLDLPFIFPNADAVDRDAARLIQADWALAHLAVPIVRAGRVLTVVVADPLHGEAMEELRSRTGCEIELALASSSRIRELIHAIYGDSQALGIGETAPTSVSVLISEALEHGAERFGISIRGAAAVGWWRTRGEIRRAPLTEGWEIALDELIRPSPLERLQSASAALEGHMAWTAELARPSGSIALEANALPGAGGSELLFRPLDTSPASAVGSQVVLPPSVITELRLLFRGGSARVGVGAADTVEARAVLPLLPALALGEPVRAAHVNDTGVSRARFTLRAEPGSAFAETVAGYEFDVVTLDLPAEGYSVQELLRTAPLTMMLLDEPEERAAPGAWGINWLLTMSGHPGSYAWDLRALHR